MHFAKDNETTPPQGADAENMSMSNAGDDENLFGDHGLVNILEFDNLFAHVHALES